MMIWWMTQEVGPLLGVAWLLVLRLLALQQLLRVSLLLPEDV